MGFSSAPLSMIKKVQILYIRQKQGKQSIMPYVYTPYIEIAPYVDAFPARGRQRSGRSRAWFLKIPGSRPVPGWLAGLRTRALTRAGLRAENLRALKTRARNRRARPGLKSSDSENPGQAARPGADPCSRLLNSLICNRAVCCIPPCVDSLSTFWMQHKARWTVLWNIWNISLNYFDAINGTISFNLT